MLKGLRSSSIFTKVSREDADVAPAHCFTFREPLEGSMCGYLEDLESPEMSWDSCSYCWSTPLVVLYTRTEGDVKSVCFHIQLFPVNSGAR